MRWSKQPHEKGLASICQGPRGMILKDHGKELARVAPLCKGFNRYNITGWYWYGSGFNTASNPVETMELAMDDALKTIKAKEVVL